MREIKFRAYWRGKLWTVQDIYFSMGTIYLVRQEWQGDNDTGHEELVHESVALKNVDLIQFTGLHDKNGKEIWEGDIFNYIDGDDTGFVEVKGKVVWDEEFAQFLVQGEHNFCTDFEGIDLEAFEVLGNIYENKELLK